MAGLTKYKITSYLRFGNLRALWSYSLTQRHRQTDDPRLLVVDGIQSPRRLREIRRLAGSMEVKEELGIRE